jgi:ferric-dicitrate binding protein FerR (iron transport regulator)
MLDVASQIEVPKDFDVSRTVRLSGEALFTVAHRAGAPFTVTTEGTSARVLGTSFTVRQYPGDTTAVVAVRDGKVAVGSAIVTALHQAEAFRDGKVRVEAADASSFTFAHGVLTLPGVPLREAIQDLNRWYDVDIVLAEPNSPLATQLVNGAFSAGPPSDLVTILSFMFNTRVERHGRMLTIYSK